MILLQRCRIKVLYTPGLQLCFKMKNYAKKTVNKSVLRIPTLSFVINLLFHHVLGTDVRLLLSRSLSDYSLPPFSLPQTLTALNKATWLQKSSLVFPYIKETDSSGYPHMAECICAKIYPVKPGSIMSRRSVLCSGFTQGQQKSVAKLWWTIDEIGGPLQSRIHHIIF